MDKHILFVTSNEARALRKNKVAFHRSFRLVFNADVIAHTGIKKDWWANIQGVDFDKRTIEISFSEEKVNSQSRKVGDPLFSKVSEYLAIRTTQLIWEHDICLFGAFDYTYFFDHKIMVIHF